MKKAIVVVSVTVSLLLPVAIQAMEIAGTQPDQRPINAPVQADVIRDNAWYRQQLQGVVGPYPQSLKFLENQGRWYTPFSYPGMPGPYNIRNW